MLFDDDPIIARFLKRLWLTWTLVLLVGIGGFGVALQLLADTIF